MATKSKVDKGRPDDAGDDTFAATPTVTNFAADAPADAATPETTASAPIEAPALEIGNSVSASLVVIQEAVEPATEAFSASFQFDGSEWPQKSLEFWAENTAAFFDLAEEIGKARTFEEVLAIQSRFASDRLAVFMRQSQALMDLARSMTTLSAAPLCGARKAA